MFMKVVLFMLWLNGFFEFVCCSSIFLDGLMATIFDECICLKLSYYL